MDVALLPTSLSRLTIYPARLLALPGSDRASTLHDVPAPGGEVEAGYHDDSEDSPDSRATSVVVSAVHASVVVLFHVLVHGTVVLVVRFVPFRWQISELPGNCIFV